MPWEEFKQLLMGISSDTALGKIVSVRAETNRDMLKRFTPEQRRIRSDWAKRKAKKVSEDDMEKILESFKQAFISMAGGGK